MKSAVVCFLVIIIGTSSPSAIAQPSRSAVTLSVGPSYARLRGDNPAIEWSHGRDYAAPGLELSARYGKPLSSTISANAIVFGDVGSSACAELVDVAVSMSAPPRPPLCLGESWLRGGGLGLGITMSEGQDGLFVAPSLWAGTLWVEPPPDFGYGVNEHSPELWFGAAVEIGWTRRIRERFSVGGSISARVGTADVADGFNRARIGVASLIVSWR